MAETYGSMLKKLAEFAGVKYSAIAAVLGYDTSYVSKWCNDVKLPMSSSVQDINQDIASLLAGHIRNLELEGQFRKAFAGTDAGSGVLLEQLIFRLLKNAYTVSLAGTKEVEAVPTDTTQVVLGHIECMAFLKGLFTREWSSLAQRGRFLVCGGFCALEKAGFWELFKDVPAAPQGMSVHVGIDFEVSGGSTDMQRLYACLSRYLEMDFTLHSIGQASEPHLLILQDRFVVQYELDTSGHIILCTYLSVPERVNEIYEAFSHYFREEDVVLRPVDSRKIDMSGLRSRFYSDRQFQFFVTNGFEYLLPEEVFIQMMLRDTDRSPADVWVKQSVRVMWEQMIGNMDITFFVPTEAFFKYVEQGYVYFTDVEYQLSVKERQEHIRHILKVLQSNHNIHIKVLQTKDFSCDVSRLSVYSNRSQAFFKKNKRHISNGSHIFYWVEQDRLMPLVRQFFSALEQSSHCRVFTSEELQQLYDKYQVYLQRLMTLAES